MVVFVKFQTNQLLLFRNQDGRFTPGDPQEPDPRAPEAAHGPGTLQRLPEGPERPGPANPWPPAHRVLQGLISHYGFDANFQMTTAPRFICNYGRGN